MTCEIYGANHIYPHSNKEVRKGVKTEWTDKIRTNEHLLIMDGQDLNSERYYEITTLPLTVSHITTLPLTVSHI